MYSPHVPELAISEPFAIEVDHRRGGSKRRALAVVAIAFLGLGAFVALSGSDNAALDSTTAASTSLSAAEPTSLKAPWSSPGCQAKFQKFNAANIKWSRSGLTDKKAKARMDSAQVWLNAHCGAAATELGAAATPTTEDAAITWSPCGFKIGPHSYSQYCGYHCVGSNCIIKEYKDGKTGRITYPVT